MSGNAPTPGGTPRPGTPPGPPAVRSIRRAPGRPGGPAGRPAGASTRAPGARPPGVLGRPSGDAVIEARGLTKRYPRVLAVDHLDLEVRRGEVFGLLGPNGAGKTTTVLMLLGLSEPTGGAARVLGLDPTRRPLEVKRRVGYLPDNVGFYADMTGRENLRYTARLNGLRGRDGEARLAEVLDQVGLSDAADRQAGTYSRGMRQRLGIADALVKGPQVLILDEPTIAIDPIGVAEILGLIRDLVRDRGVTVLLSSHLLDQVQTTCDRVGIFYGGRMIACGTVDELSRTAGMAPILDEVSLVGGSHEDGERILRSLPGVSDVSALPGAPNTWVITGDADESAPLIRALDGTGIRLARLERRGHQLQEIYRRLVGGADVAAADAQEDRDGAGR